MGLHALFQLHTGPQAALDQADIKGGFDCLITN